MKKDKLNEGPEDFDFSDTPEEPTQRSGKKSPPPIPVRSNRPSGPPRFLPGANNAPYTRNRGPRRESSPFGQDKRASDPGAAPQQRMRSRAPTQQIQPAQETNFEVTVPGIGVYRVPASDEMAAKLRIDAWLRSGEATGNKVSTDPNRFTVKKVEEGTTGGDIAGYQMPQEEAYKIAVKEAIRDMVREIVRKKAGGGGYVLYGPNKGKKKDAKPVGEFPTRLAAKRAELARFPPKDPEQLKRARKRLDRLMKDPKKRAEKEQEDLSGRKKPHRTGAPARDRKKAAKEAFINIMANDLHERLFHEDEVPGSHWDEKIASLHPDAIASDKKLALLHKNMEKSSLGALGDAHKGLSKVLKGMATVQPGDVSYDPDRRKTFMPVMLDCDGTEIGPVHLYIDGGHVKIEVSREARQAIAEMEPDAARDLRGGLMSFEEDHLPKIVQAQNAWSDRDSYLDRLHGKLEKQATGLSGVEHHILKSLLAKGGKK